jgi:hypothetical protein
MYSRIEFSKLQCNREDLKFASGQYCRQYKSIICFFFPYLPASNQSEPTPTSAWTGMDGALIGFSFLSLCHPRFTSFVYPFSTLISLDFGFFLQLYFLPAFTWFLCFCFFLLLKLFPPTHLLTCIFKLKVDSSPSTYSPINEKCPTFIPTYLATLPPSYLPRL